MLSVLRIIELLLELAVEAVKGMTPDQKAAFWERHERRMEFWQGVLERITD